MSDERTERILLHDPGHGAGFQINDIYAFVAVHADGDEGILARTIGSMLTPLIGADLERLQQLRPIAEELATATGKVVKLVRFTNRTELDVIQP